MKVLNKKELQEKLLNKVKEQAKDGALEDTSLLQDVFSSDINININDDLYSEFEADLVKQIKKTLLTLLSRREYSQQELREKLNSKNFPHLLSETILEDFKRDNYQSDQRYCEMLIRSRIIKLSGPFKIRMELRQKGVSENLVEQTISDAGCNWFDLALEAAKKKTINWKIFEFEDKAKLMRFLQGRGFEQEQITYAVDRLSKER